MASELINVAHQLGSPLGLSILVTVFAKAGAALNDAKALLTADTIMLSLAFVVVIVLIVRSCKRL